MSHDAAMWRKAARKQRERGCSIYIPAQILSNAGIDPTEAPPLYRTTGYRRSRNGHTVIVSLRRA